MAKASVTTSKRLFYALDSLSKNTWIDVIVDRAMAEIGEGATDEQLADLIQGWIGPVLLMRNDRPFNIRPAMNFFDDRNSDHEGVIRYPRPGTTKGETS